MSKNKIITFKLRRSKKGKHTHSVRKIGHNEDSKSKGNKIYNILLMSKDELWSNHVPGIIREVQ